MLKKNFFVKIFFVQNTEGFPAFEVYGEKEISTHKIQTKEDFNHILKLFINEDPILGIYIMNQVLKFLYPCKV